MSDVRVKICGLTDPAQASFVQQAGADAVGLVFAPSRRQVTPAQAARIVDALPAATWKVGVFVDERPEIINPLARRVGLTHVQLHGREAPGVLADLELPAVKAFGVRSGQFILEVHDWLVCLPPGCEDRLVGVLFDAVSPHTAGGTGTRFNWDLLESARAEGNMDDLPEIFLAGGLDPSNAAEAVRRLQPEWLDVSSGVERAPGVKDPDKVAAFLRNAKHLH